MSLRVAVIGVGSMGRNHVRVYRELPDVELVGVADLNLEAAEAVARRAGTQAYVDYRRLLDEERPQAITIATPTVHHLPIALEAIQRGIHVLVEKPIASDTGQARHMIEAAERAGVCLMVGHVERFNPALAALKQRLAEGQLGRLYQVDARRQGPYPMRVKDVGVTVDLAVHELDIIRYLSQAEVTRVYAEVSSRVSSHEEMLSGLVRLSDDTVGTLTISWLTPTKIRELYMTGERGMFRLDYLTQDLYFYENATAEGVAWETLRVFRGVSEGQMIRYAVKKREPLQAELEAFLAAVRGEAPAAVSGLDGLRALQLAQALLQSAREHQAIVPELDASASQGSHRHTPA